MKFTMNDESRSTCRKSQLLEKEERGKGDRIAKG